MTRLSEAMRQRLREECASYWREYYEQVEVNDRRRQHGRDAGSDTGADLSREAVSVWARWNALCE